MVQVSKFAHGFLLRCLACFRDGLRRRSAQKFLCNEWRPCLRVQALRVSSRARIGVVRGLPNPFFAIESTHLAAVTVPQGVR